MFTDPNTLEQEEFVETQYYKELDSIDKQHYATGSGFIKVVSEKGEEEYALQLPGAEENINGGYRKMGREKTTKMLKIMGGEEEIVVNTLTAYKAAHDRLAFIINFFNLNVQLSVSGVVITVAIVAIVFAIIDCLKKTGSAIPMYARIATNEKMKATEQPLTSDSVAVAIPPNYPLSIDSQVQGATEERILCNIAREKPIAFSRQEIEENSPKTIPNWVLLQPEARPAMSTVVKMLEGEIEITPPPYPKFQSLEYRLGRFGLASGTTSEPSSSNHVQGTLGIESST
ncbi:unnamed protein product [Ilex paraguariensis]|uniref:Uncharacterized protein n=1 Tax=Ilex paraguariensis TaxID=185542 RepID=A0ABC8TIY3_9AQUA